MGGAVEYRDEDVAGRVGRSTSSTDTVFEQIRLHGEPVLVTEPYREIDRAMMFSESLSPGERRLRWFIVGWLTLSTILNLINRNTLSIIAPTFSSRFSGVSFTNAANLVAKLRSPPEPVSEYLRSRFVPGAGCPCHVVLSDGTRKLMAQNPQAESRHPAFDAILRTFQIKSREPQVEHQIRLNRSLLRDAYPGQIAEIPFEVTDMAYGLIIMAFQLSYCIMYLAAGRFVDRVGEKIGMTACIVWWSICTMLHALARGVSSLGLFRFFLGIGEPGNYPAALRASARWFSKEERGLPIAIWSSGSSVGNLLSVPLIAFLALRFGWQMAFLIPGFLGIIWVAVWIIKYRMPSVAVDGPGIAGASSWQAQASLEPGTADEPKSETFLDLLKDRRVWAITLARLLTDPIWVFYLTWTPKYLAEVWNFDLV